jgi:xanthine dehydrogenase accessory factor
VNGDVIGDAADEGEECDKSLFYAKALRVMDGKIVELVLITSTPYMYAAGHISQFISKAAKTVDFNVIVMDDRPQFANRLIEIF